jgi:hypothetical protein
LRRGRRVGALLLVSLLVVRRSVCGIRLLVQRVSREQRTHERDNELRASLQESPSGRLTHNHRWRRLLLLWLTRSRSAR